MICLMVPSCVLNEPLKFSLKSSPTLFQTVKAGRGIRSVTAVQHGVSDVTAALQKLQDAYPTLMDTATIATVDSYLNTGTPV